VRRPHGQPGDRSLVESSIDTARLQAETLLNGEATMTLRLETKRDAIVQACKRHGVARLEAFGSVLGDDFQPGESDVDLLVELGPMAAYARVDAFFGLRADLRDILGHEVDLVMAGAVKNPYISREIARTKQVLYAA
jgi:hypothetical protein